MINATHLFRLQPFEKPASSKKRSEKSKNQENERKKSERNANSHSRNARPFLARAKECELNKTSQFVYTSNEIPVRRNLREKHF